VSAKHKIKLLARDAWARLLYHTGLHRLVDRAMPRRLTILAGHCVSAPCNDRLPGDMKIPGERLERILAFFARHYEVTSVGAGVRRIAEPGGKSLVALSMDDGYRDNRTHLLPLLERLGVSATVYLESRPLEERRVNWSHKFFWILDRVGLESFAERYVVHSRDERANALLRAARPRSYDLKRVLKYEAPAAERARAIDRLFAELGGDERALCDELYLSLEDARALRDAGLELGGHTVGHEILSRLDDRAARAEVEGCRTALLASLGTGAESFAYPFGRRWDYGARTQELVAAAGYASAVTTHAGTNDARTARYELKRLMIDENAELHLLAAEACGGFDLLRRVGIDLSE
jgi:peptidoglycan/xylan/chitin deacetylase (PgdA/CDA1 family)